MSSISAQQHPTQNLLVGPGEIESDGKRFPFETGDAIYNKENGAHRVFNTGTAEPVRLPVVAGLMFVGLLPDWPTPGPYEILEPTCPAFFVKCPDTLNARRLPRHRHWSFVIGHLSFPRRRARVGRWVAFVADPG